jgi:hypothetical protein
MRFVPRALPTQRAAGKTLSDSPTGLARPNQHGDRRRAVLLRGIVARERDPHHLEPVAGSRSAMSARRIKLPPGRDTGDSAISPVRSSASLI